MAQLKLMSSQISLMYTGLRISLKVYMPLGQVIYLFTCPSGFFSWQNKIIKKIFHYILQQENEKYTIWKNHYYDTFMLSIFFINESMLKKELGNFFGNILQEPFTWSWHITAYKYNCYQVLN